MNRRPASIGIVFGLGLVAGMLALWLRLLVPVGWMPVITPGGVTYVLCSGSGGQRPANDVSGKAAEPGSEMGSCAFAGMGTPALADVPATVALVIFQLFLALGLASTALPRRRGPTWLRPPLRGPPAIA